MPTAEETRACAVAFAQALDNDDFALARALVDEACVYSVRGEVHHGPDAVVESYAGAAEFVRGTFDAHRYESAVDVTAPGRARIDFADHLRHAGREHTFRSHQHIELGAAGRVVRITHEDLPGQREALDRWLTIVGVARRGE